MGKFWKIFKWLAIFVIGFFVLDAALVLFFGFYRPGLKKADAIVVLGAAVNTAASYNRAMEGLKLYQQGYAPVIVVSGGQDYPKSKTEAGYMQTVIQSAANGPVNIILEDQSHSTYDNLVNTEAKLGVGKSLIIVSDDYHLARGVIVAMREGFKPIYWAAPSIKYYSHKDIVYYYGREVLAMISYLPKFIKG